MAVSLQKLSGITSELEAKLRARGIRETRDLLRACRTAADRAELSGALGIESQAILVLAQRADLSRIRGIGEVYINLLEHAGIRTMDDLAASGPEDLHSKFMEINAELNLAGRVPALPMARGWVQKAQKLPRLLE